MAHELLIENGRASMFYVERVPWHRLGTRLEKPPGSSEEAIAAAGLDWEVVKAPLYVSGVGRLIALKDRFAMVRRDHLDRPDCCPFGLVGRDYEPLQNRDAFKFFDPLIREQQLTFETAGALGSGERVWILARFKGNMTFGPEELERYLLLANTHNGTGSVTVRFTPIRVVCQNTLSAACGGKERVFRVRHDRLLDDRLEQTGELLATVLETYSHLRDGFESMLRVRLDADALDSYLSDVFPAPSSESGARALEEVQRHRRAASHLYQYGAGNQEREVQGTLWAAYNGVTEYIDHRKPNARAHDFSGSRLNYVWFGAGATIKQRALVEALQRSDPNRVAALALQ
jgi:phage/plasmid-like protein (TIGR03299 family)